MLTFSVLALLYFLPSILAHNKRSFTAIFLLDALLGWTVIGWVIALIWSLAGEPAAPRVIVIPAAAPAGHFCGSCGAPLAHARCPHCGHA